MVARHWVRGEMGSEGYRVLGPPGGHGGMGPCSLVACDLEATETLPWGVALLLGPRMLLSAEAVSPCALEGEWLASLPSTGYRSIQYRALHWPGAGRCVWPTSSLTPTTAAFNIWHTDPTNRGHEGGEV